MTERLRRISYTAMMGFLKQSSLQELAYRHADPSNMNAVGVTSDQFPQSSFHAAGILAAYPEVKEPYEVRIYIHRDRQAGETNRHRSPGRQHPRTSTPVTIVDATLPCCGRDSG